jgi:cytochrome c biogenesis protein
LRFASIDFAYNPGGVWVLLFSLLALGSLTLSLLWPRRRVWVRVNQDGVIEMAALAKGDDQRLEQATTEIRKRLEKEIA